MYEIVTFSWNLDLSRVMPSGSGGNCAAARPTRPPSTSDAEVSILTAHGMIEAVEGVRPVAEQLMNDASDTIFIIKKTESELHRPRVA